MLAVYRLLRSSLSLRQRQKGTTITPPEGKSDACAHKGCHRSPWEEDPHGFCLCHSPENGKTESTARTVRREAHRMAREDKPDYEGWHFPPGTDFSGTRFEAKAIFQNATFHGEAKFLETCFANEADFQNVTFAAGMDFHSASFIGIARFNRACFKGYMSFENARFEKSAIFRNITADRFIFDGVECQACAFFDHAVFGKYAHFGGFRCHDRVEFCGAHFGEYTWFVGSRFVDVDFRDAVFEGQAHFDFMHVAQQIILYDHRHREKPFLDPTQGAEAYRVAKQLAHIGGDYSKEGRYHYSEQCALDAARRKGVAWRLGSGEPCTRDGNTLLAWGGFFLGRCLFGYGEKPLRVLLWALGVILVWTGIYWIPAVMAGSNTGQSTAFSEFSTSLYFGIVTFTTLGYGDLHPPASLRLWATMEAVLGVILVALFVVSLTRKFAR